MKTTRSERMHRSGFWLLYLAGFIPVCPLPAQLDETWTVSVNGQSAPVREDGSFRVGNISAGDSFGPDGPGTLPDNVSDDFFQIEGVSTDGGVTRYVVSEPFQIKAGEAYTVSRLTVSDRPPPKPVSLRLEGPRDVVLGGTVELTTIGVLGDGTEVDLTLRLANTIYRSSNTSVATIDGDGIVSPRKGGSVFITATNAGATAVKRIDVRSDLVITITGFVRRQDGSAVAGAQVAVLGSMAVTGADGSFTLTLSVEEGRQLFVEVSAVIDGVLHRASAGPIAAQAGRTIDVGFLDLVPEQPRRDFLFANPNLPLGQTFLDAMTSGDADGDGDVDIVYFDTGGDDYSLAVLANEGETRFAEPTRFPLDLDSDGFNAELIRLADLDGDGDLDAATLSTGSGSALHAAVNLGGGEFSGGAAFAVGNRATDLALADLDGDTFLDAAVTNRVEPGTVTLLTGTGEGGFIPGGVQTALPQDSAEYLAAGDIDSDGDEDLLVTGTNETQAALLLNDGAGGFPQTSSYDVRGFSVRPLLEDLDEDGDLDAAFAYEFADRLGIALNQGGGQLGPPSFFLGTKHPIFIRAADLDGDGDLDLASAGEEEDVVVLRNGGGGAFAEAGRTFSLSEPTGLEAFDTTGDGLPEVFVSSRDAINMLLNLGGSFGDEQRMLPGLDIRAHALADFNFDGSLDIAAHVFGFPTSHIRSLVGSGGGSFAEEPFAPPAASITLPTKLITGDFEGDGLLDLAGVGFDSGFGTHKLFFHSNAGAAGFTPATILALAAGDPMDLALGDVDGDGDLDAAAGLAAFPTSLVSFVANDGGSSFAESSSLPLSGFFRAFALADLDADGRTDLLTVEDDFATDSGQVVFHRNLGPTGFAAGKSNRVDRQPMHTLVEDLDGDADLDLALSHVNFPAQLTVLANDGTGSLVTASEVETTSAANLEAGDADGDGDTDILALGFATNAFFQIFLQDGAGFGESQAFDTGQNGNGLSAGDLDLDGDLDVVINHGRGISLHLNGRRPEPITVTITGLVLLPDSSPAAGALVRAGEDVSVQANAQGAFSIAFDAFPGAEITLRIEIEVEGQVLAATFTARVRPDQTLIDAGTLRLRAPPEGPLFSVPAYPAQAGARMDHLAAADLDADGDPDLVGSDGQTVFVHVLRNRGDGVLERSDALQAGLGPGRAAGGDLDGDGDTDIAVPNSSDGTVSVLRAEASGELTVLEGVPIGPSPSALGLGDLDGDADVDIVAGIRGFPGPLAVISNQGGGMFSAPVRRGSGNIGSSCALGDLDRDGDLDIAAMVDGQPGSLLNPGTGAFGAFNGVPSAGSSLLQEVLLGDLDGDQDLDLAYADFEKRVRISKNNGAGSFAAPALHTAGNTGSNLALLDLDGDQDLDLATANDINPRFATGAPSEPDIIVHRNSGSGSFVRSEEYAGGLQRFALLAADFDTDGDQDLALGAESTYAAIIFNRGDGILEANTSLEVGLQPHAVAAADFNGDGRLDLAAANMGFCCDPLDGTLSVLVSHGGGAFAPTSAFGRGSLAQSVAAGDLDGDGDVDVALTYAGTCCDFADASVQVLRNNGAAVFSIDRDYTLPSQPGDVAAGDLDNDGDMDLACGLAGFPGGIAMLLNQGGGAFADFVLLPGESPTGDLELGDVDGDASLDIAAVYPGQAALFFNPGDGAFGAPELYPAGGFNARSLALGELDGSPGLDLAVTVDQGFVVFSNGGQRTFVRAVRWAEDEPFLETIALADVDLDGRLDVACVSAQDTVALFLGDGLGGFEAELRYLTGQQTTALTAGDLDGDGDPDLAAPNATLGRVIVHFNRARP